MNTHYGFMRDALRLANYALQTGETPVACIFVYGGKIISYGMNNTNDSLSGITHAEFRGIKQILEQVKENKDWKNYYTHPHEIFKEIDLYVTVEPCVMCASALKQIGIRSVYFGCGNERFGGNGSVMKVNADNTLDYKYLSYPGIYRREAIVLLRDFYTHENAHAPVPRNKKNRELKLDSFPELIWMNYLSKEEFIKMFGLQYENCYDANTDLNEEIDTSILKTGNIDISDIKQSVDEPLQFHHSKRRKFT
jgi:tRNA-specific adenosine deaminase 2